MGSMIGKILAVTTIFIGIVWFFAARGENDDTTVTNQQAVSIGSNAAQPVAVSSPAPLPSNTESLNGVLADFPSSSSGEYTGPVLTSPLYRNCVEAPRDSYRMREGEGYQQFQSAGAARPNVRIFRVPRNATCPSA